MGARDPCQGPVRGCERHGRRDISSEVTRSHRDSREQGGHGKPSCSAPTLHRRLCPLGCWLLGARQGSLWGRERSRDSVNRCFLGQRERRYLWPGTQRGPLFRLCEHEGTLTSTHKSSLFSSNIQKVGALHGAPQGLREEAQRRLCPSQLLPADEGQPGAWAAGHGRWQTGDGAGGPSPPRASLLPKPGLYMPCTFQPRPPTFRCPPALVCQPSLRTHPHTARPSPPVPQLTPLQGSLPRPLI